MEKISIRIRVLITVMTIVTIGLLATVGLLAEKARAMQEEAAREYAQELGRRYAAQLSHPLSSALDVARALAQSLGSLKQAQVADRNAADLILKNALASNPSILGTWTVWEPDAFDGKDQQFMNKPGHDATGRYIPYWNRGTGSLGREPLVDYEKEGAGDFYLLPKKSREETLLEPYLYKVAGKDSLLTTIAVPIILEGKFVGVAGADLSLDSMQRDVGAIRPYGSGYVSILSNTGKFIAAPDPALLGKDIGNGPDWQAIKSAIAKGKEITQALRDDKSGNALHRYYVPVTIGAVKTPWSIAVTLPEKEVMARVSSLRNTAGVLSVLSLISVCVTLVIVIDRLVIRPLGGEPRHAIAIAQNIAAGDLSTEVAGSGREQDSMMAAIGSMQSQLRQIVARIRAISDAVSVASAEIAEGNADLSRRTESQAASLEETAASLQEMAITIKQNADNARQANAASQDASHSVKHAGHVVVEVVDTMEEIFTASKKMDDILSVIDGIAFQTNILALNAAVEAARAGDQGRGFAVVATEVRSLAQRCSNASRDISALIDATRQKIGDGTDRAHKAGKAMDDVVSAIEKVSTRISEISLASEQQSSGVIQISQTVSHMDGATQQNAALVEEAAMAANSLQERARELIAAVAVFRTTEPHNASEVPVQPGVSKRLSLTE